MPTAILAEAYCFCHVTKNLECFELFFFWWFLCLNILHRQFWKPFLNAFTKLNYYHHQLRFSSSKTGQKPPIVKFFWRFCSNFCLKIHIFFHFGATIKLKTVLERLFWMLSQSEIFITVNRRFRAVKPVKSRRLLYFCTSFVKVFLKTHIFHDFRARKFLKTVLETCFWVLSEAFHFTTVNRR